MNPWKTLDSILPEPGQLCWCRIQYYYGKPFQAIWFPIESGFYSVDTNIFYPAWSIARYKLVV